MARIRPVAAQDAATATGVDAASPPRDVQRAGMIATALAMLDESGLDDFSMRKLAARLGMSVSNLYLYFADRDELLDAVRDSVLSEINAGPVDLAGEWQAAVKRVMQHYRNELRVHPGAVVLLQRTALVSPEMWRLGQTFQNILKGAGIADPEQRLQFSRILVWTLSGFIAQEEALSNRTVVSGSGAAARQTLTLSPATVKLIMDNPEALRQGSDIDVEQLFVALMDTVVAGIASTADLRRS